MARIIAVTATVVAALFLVIEPGASAGAERWAWFDASPLGDGWDIRRGEAEVEIQGGKLVARLYENGREAITLRGTVKNGRVEVTAVLLNTDMEPTKLVGRHGRVQWKKYNWPTREAILLTAPERPWDWTIGLTRELAKP